MESFELGKELEKDVFRLVTRVRHIKYSKSPWGIEPQTFGFCAPMLYYWATDTVSEVYYEVHSPKLAISLIISKNNTLWTHADPSSVQDGVSCIWELHNRSRLRWNLCGSVVAHRSAESEGLRLDSLWRLRIFSLSHARDKTKNLSLHLIMLATIWKKVLTRNLHLGLHINIRWNPTNPSWRKRNQINTFKNWSLIFKI